MGSKKIVAWALGITLAASTGLLLTATAAQALPVAEKVTICHLGSSDDANKYVSATISVNAVGRLDKDEGGHANGHAGDIIPAFGYTDKDDVHQEFTGKNLDRPDLIAIAKEQGCVPGVIIIIIVDPTTSVSTTASTTSSSPPLGLPTTSSSATSSAPSTTATTTTKPPTTTVTTTAPSTTVATTAPASTTVVAGPPLGGGGLTPVAVPRAPTPVLAQTGFDTAGFASAGLGLLALGSAFLLAARRVDPSA